MIAVSHDIPSTPKDNVYHLPELLAAWPWTRQLNPFFEEAKAASSAWIAGFDVLSDRSLTGFFECKFELLTALAYPTVTREQLRLFCDLMQLFFVIDGFTDSADVVSAREMADAVMEGMWHPERPQKSILGEISRDFWSRAIPEISEDIRDRFVEAFQLYVDAVVEQAQDRADNVVRTLAEYFPIRRKTIGMGPCVVLLQIGLGLHPSMYTHPTIVQLETHAIDMICIAQDIYSYNIEQARGDDLHNSVTLVQKEFGVSLDHALLWLQAHNERLARGFVEMSRQFKDGDVSRYIDGLANWVRAHDSWSFESERYFGAHGDAVQLQRRVALLPCSASSSVL